MRIRTGDIVVLSKRSKEWLDDDEQHLAGSFAEVTKSSFSHDEYVFDIVFPQHKTKLLGVPSDYLHKSIPE